MTAPPREPTDKAIKIAIADWMEAYPETDWVVAREIFRAGYAAAPAPPAAQPAEVCGDRGFAGPSCCTLPRGHVGEHKYGKPVAQPAEPPATDATPFVYLMNRMERAAQQNNPAAHEYAKHRAAVFEFVERQARERSDMSVDIEKYRSEIAELKSERDAAQRAGVTTANYWMERAELAEDQRERTRDVWATRAERAEAERDEWERKAGQYMDERDALLEDADRYRWLRDYRSDSLIWIHATPNWQDPNDLHSTALDAAIDAARAKVGK